MKDFRLKSKIELLINSLFATNVHVYTCNKNFMYMKYLGDSFVQTLKFFAFSIFKV